MAPNDIDDELTRLRAVSVEYNVTVRVLAVVIELLLARAGGDCIEISDHNLENSPTLHAWRKSASRTVAISVSRDNDARHTDT